MTIKSRYITPDKETQIRAEEAASTRDEKLKSDSEYQRKVMIGHDARVREAIETQTKNIMDRARMMGNPVPSESDVRKQVEKRAVEFDRER